MTGTPPKAAAERAEHVGLSSDFEDRELVLERGGGRGYRVLTFDALVGRPLRWDAPEKDKSL